MDKQYFVYIMSSMKQGTLYMGVTSNLIKRVWEHKQDLVRGFTAKYKIHKLVYFETFKRIEDAIKREKQLKNWSRQWKIALIEKSNKQWQDLYSQLR